MQQRKGRVYLPSDRRLSNNPSSPIWDFIPPTGVPSPPDVEDRVRSFVPPTGYLRQWVEWCHVRSDCPSVYNVGSWLTTLSVLVKPTLRVIGPGVTKIRPNLFTLLVGPSGESRKTWAIQAISELFANSQKLATRLGDSSGSLQGLITSLQDKPNQIVLDEDMGDLLQAGQKGPVQQLKLFFNKVFDGGRATHRLKAEAYRAEDYSFSYLTGINWPLLEKFSEPTDFTGGLFSRFLTLDSRVTRHMPSMATRIPDSYRQQAIDYFTSALLAHMDFCPEGVIEISDEAADLLSTWEDDFQGRYVEDKTKESLRPAFARVMPLATRSATLYAFDRYISTGPTAPTAIQYDDARCAIGLVEEHLHSISNVHGRVAATNYQRDRRTVLEAIPEANDEGRWATIGMICKATQRDLRSVKNIVETLVAEGTVRDGKMVGTKVGFQQTPPPQVRVLPQAISAPPPPPIAPQWADSYGEGEGVYHVRE